MQKAFQEIKQAVADPIIDPTQPLHAEQLVAVQESIDECDFRESTGLENGDPPTDFQELQ